MTVLRSEFFLELEIDGKRFDVASFDADFRLNTIPQARCMLAVGRQADTGEKAAAIHDYLDSFKTTDNVAKVHFCPRGEWSEKNNWPEGDFVIFEGRVNGLGYAKSNEGKIMLTASIQHWLGDLDFSSMISEQCHLQNPAELTFEATLNEEDQAGAEPEQCGLYMLSAASVINETSIMRDLWGEALKPFFCAIAQDDLLEISADIVEVIGEVPNDNSQALAALSRIEGVSTLGLSSDPAAKCNKELSCYTPKLAMNVEGLIDNEETLGEAIETAIMEKQVVPVYSTTFWNALVGGYAPMFSFAVVPLIDKALVVPFIPGLRTTWCKQIKVCDYADIQIESNIARPIRAVVLYGGMSSETNYDTNSEEGQGAPQVMQGVGGAFQPKNASSKGMVLMQRPPAWLDMLLDSATDVNNTLGEDDTSAVSSSVTPQTSHPDTLRTRKDGTKREDVMRASREVFNSCAHVVYTQEMLRGRTGQITSGKLRFDIAPGSTVLIEGSSELFLSGADKLGQNMIATVEGVTVAINAEAGRAGTGFRLDHVRTEEENTDDRFSVACHPLYLTKFPGAPLHDDLWFRDEGADCCTGLTCS